MVDVSGNFGDFMILSMAGLDYTTASVELREQLSFHKTQVEALDRKICALPGVSGAVLLSTCNRTELYLTSEEPVAHPGRLLCQAAGREWSRFKPFFFTRTGEDAARYLMEVAAGLHSQIWGEDQIVTQVGNAMEVARAGESMNSVLSTLFHTAVAAAKEIKTYVTFTAVPSSAAAEAVELLRKKLHGLQGKRAVVIGNGEMGRLSARLLHSAGAKVTVTLRTYRHGETVVPYGCETIPYDRRLEAIDGADILFSATTSPHYTFTREQALSLRRCPASLIDLAIPRDIQPEAALDGAQLYNVDDFGMIPRKTDLAAREQAERMVEKHLREFYEWWDYRDCIPVMGELKAALGRRFAAEGAQEYQAIVDRTVELMLGGLKGRVNAESLRECAAKIDAFTRPRRKAPQPEKVPFRFPVFADLRGKKIVLVGGGSVARRRINTLLPFAPELVVIAPELEGSTKGICWQQRSYQTGDLEGAFLAIAATDSRQVNRQVGEDAKAMSIPVSVADAREECTFFFPAICQGQEVLAGVVSRGDEHRTTAKAAKKIREILEENSL